MAMTERSRVLLAFRDAVRREADEIETDSALAWQQLSNRLQWDKDAGPLVDAERAWRADAGQAWLRGRTTMAESPALKATLRTDAPLATCAVSPDGDFLVVGSGSSEVRPYDVRVLDARSRRVRHTLPAVGRVLGCAVSPDSRSVLVCQEEPHQGSALLYRWEPATGEPAGAPLPVAGTPRSLALSPDGRLAAVRTILRPTPDAWPEYRTTIVDMATWEPTWHLSGKDNRPETCAFDPDGSRLVIGGSTVDKDAGLGILIVRRTSDWQTEHVLVCGRGEVSALAFSPDGSRLAVVQPQAVRVLDTTAWTGVVQLPMSVTSPVWGPDGSFLAGVAGHNLLLWETADWKQRATLVGHEGSVQDCAVAPDGSYLLSVGWDRAVKVWDTAVALRRGGARVPRPRHIPVVGDVASTAEPPSRWGLAAGTVRPHNGNARPVAVTPDGATLVDSDGRVLGPDGSVTWLDGAKLSTAVDIGPDGGLVACCEKATVTTYDARTGELRHTLEGHRGTVNDLAIGPDGRMLLTASNDCTLRIWDLETGAETRKLLGHLPRGDRLAVASVLSGGSGAVVGVLACAWSPDGSVVVSAGGDGSLRVWDPRTGEQVRVLATAPSPMHSCAVTPDGAHVVAFGDDRDLAVWEIATGERVARAPLARGPERVVVHPSQALFGCPSLGGFDVFEAVGLRYESLVTPVVAGGVPICPACRTPVAGAPAESFPCPSCRVPLRIPDLAAARPRPPRTWRAREARRQRQIRRKQVAHEAELGTNMMARLNDWASVTEEVELPSRGWRQRLRLRRQER